MRGFRLGLVGLQLVALVGCGSQHAQTPPPAAPKPEAHATPPPPQATPPATRSAAVESAPGEEDDKTTEPGPLSIFIVDIGQGDSTVILGPPLKKQDELGRRMALVVDAGDLRPDGGKIVKALLAEQGVKEVDYVVLSHYDADHLGGFVNVSGSESVIWKSENCEPTEFFPTKALIDNGDSDKTSKSAEQWMKCAPKAGEQHIRVTGGRELGRALHLGGGYTATIVAGDGYVLGHDGQVNDVDTANEKSIALLVSGPDDFEFLVTGDLIGQAAGAEDAKLEPALAEGLASKGVDLEVLRIGHHGAANATEKTFVETMKPEVAIISTGDGQKANYKHPRCQTYKTLKAAKVGLVLQTETGKPDCSPLPMKPVVMDGTIQIDVRGSKYTLQGYGEASPTNDKATNRAVFECSVKDGCVEAAIEAPVAVTR